MGGVNLFGLVLVALGGFLVFLGVTGRYRVFTGASASSSSGPTQAQSNANAASNAQAFTQGVQSTTDTSGLLSPGEQQAFGQGFFSGFFG